MNFQGIQYYLARFRPPEEAKSLIASVESRIRRVETRQFKHPLDLAAQRAYRQSPALPADLPPDQEQLAKSRAGHVVEMFQINQKVARLGLRTQGQRLHRIFQVFAAMRIESTGDRQNLDVAIHACLKRGHRGVKPDLGVINEFHLSQANAFLSFGDSRGANRFAHFIDMQISLRKKVALWFAFVALAVGVAGFAGFRRLSTYIRNEAELQMEAKLEHVVDVLEATNSIYLDLVRSSMRV